MTRRIAILDGGSFVLSYDLELARALVRDGMRVDFYGSETRYDAGFLQALRDTPGVTVHTRAISGSVAPRWRGALAYAALLTALWRRRALYDIVNFQFSALWPFEVLLGWLLSDRLVYTVHNAVPHSFAGSAHRPTQWLATLAQRLIFPSPSTQHEFGRRYGAALRAKSTVLTIGLLPVAPGDPAIPYRPPHPIRSLIYWSTVKPYKGVELFADLARSEAVHARGLTLEVHGAWARELLPLREELVSLGVEIDDSYLDAAQLHRLLSRDDAVFLLPYRGASQSGALSTLLQQGRFVICTDVGDLGGFMRRHGLDALLMKERSANAVLACLQHLEAHPQEVTAAFDAAQRRTTWDAAMDEAGHPYRAL